MTYCGSEVRLIQPVEYKRNPFAKHKDYPFANKYDPQGHLPPILRFLKRQIVFRYNVPIYDGRKIWMMKYQNIFIQKFTAIRDNYRHAAYVIPKSKIISDLLINNITVSDPMRFTPTGNKVLKIVHAPSNGLLKGSRYIEKAIEELIDEGESIEYVKIENMAFEKAKMILKQDADIVVDQLILGSIGSVSIEAMSYAKPVIAYMLDDIIKEHCPDLPIFNANIETFKSQLLVLIQNEELRKSLSIRGSEYIRKYYNKVEMVNRMLEVYKSL
jgi:hypothetical protein